MARALLDPSRSPLSARLDPPEARAFVHRDLADRQIVDIDACLLTLVLRLGVRDGRANELRQRQSETLRRECQQTQRLLDALPANLIREQARLKALTL